MAELYFNAHGKVHSLRLLYDSDGLVWEGLVDGAEYIHFEAAEDAEIWDLFNLAVSAYAEYRKNDQLELRFKKPRGCDCS